MTLLYSVLYTVHASPLDDQENVSDDGDDNLAANDTDPHLNHATNNSICSCIVLREPSPRNTHKLNHENMTKYFLRASQNILPIMRPAALYSLIELLKP